MMRAIGFDHVIDYRKENFTRNGRRYDLILDTSVSEAARALSFMMPISAPPIVPALAVEPAF